MHLSKKKFPSSRRVRIRAWAGRTERTEERARPRHPWRRLPGRDAHRGPRTGESPGQLGQSVLERGQQLLDGLVGLPRPGHSSAALVVRVIALFLSSATAAISGSRAGASVCWWLWQRPKCRRSCSSSPRSRAASERIVRRPELRRQRLAVLFRGRPHRPNQGADEDIRIENNSTFSAPVPPSLVLGSASSSGSAWGERAPLPFNEGQVGNSERHAPAVRAFRWERRQPRASLSAR